MKAYKQKNWQHEITGADGNTILFGVNIFDYDWERTGKKVQVKDPLYNQDYEFTVYSVIIDGEKYEFAAGEFSMCVWGFYIEKY